MTDPELTRRAEQAYLGALIARNGRHGTGTVVAGDPGQHTGLTPGDFTDPVHQAIFAALTSQAADIRTGSLAGWLDRLRGLTERLLSPWARGAATYMARLPDWCPDPGNLDAYAAMIAEASRHRAAQAAAQPAQPASPARPAGRPAVKAPVLDGAATWLSDTAAAATPTRRRPQLQAQAPAVAPPAAAGAQPEAGGASPETARLVRALRASLPAAARPGAGNGPGQARLAPAGNPVSNPGPAGDQVAAPGSAEELERRLLATVLNHRAEAVSIAGWMPAEAFTSAPLRDLYELACQRLENGGPVDPLIIAWDASQLPGRSEQDQEHLARLALHLGTLNPAPPTGAALRRAVQADYVLSALIGPSWDTDAERVRQLIAPAPRAPGQQHGEPEPVPATATTAPQATPAAGPLPAPSQPETGSAPARHPEPAQARSGQPAPAQPLAAQLLRRPPVPAVNGPVQRM